MNVRLLALFLVISFSTLSVADTSDDLEDYGTPPCPIEAGKYAFENSKARPIEVKCSEASGRTFIVAEFRDCSFAQGFFEHMKGNEWFYHDTAGLPYSCTIRLFIDSKTSFRARFEHLKTQPVFTLKRIP